MRGAGCVRNYTWSLSLNEPSLLAGLPIFCPTPIPILLLSSMHMPAIHLQSKAMEPILHLVSYLSYYYIYRLPCRGGSAKPPSLSSPPGGIPDGAISCRQFFMLGRKNNTETLIVYIRFLDAVLDRYQDVQGICAHSIYCNK